MTLSPPLFLETRVYDLPTEAWYVIGVLHGDGSLIEFDHKTRKKSKNGIKTYIRKEKRLALQTSSKKFAEHFASMLRELGFTVTINGPYKRTVFGKELTYYNVQTYTSAYNYFFDNMNRVPVSDADFYAFLSGFFDSDGCLVHDNKGAKTYTYLDFSNSDRVLLETIREQLVNRGFHPTRIYERKPSKTPVKQNSKVWRFKIGRQREVCELIRRMRKWSWKFS